MAGHYVGAPAAARSGGGREHTYVLLNLATESCISRVQAAQRVPTVGHIVGVLWELRDLVAVAKGNKANCTTLAAFGADIMRAFDFQGGLLLRPLAHWH